MKFTDYTPHEIDLDAVLAGCGPVYNAYADPIRHGK